MQLPITELVMEKKLKWFDHASHRDQERLSKEILFRDLQKKRL